VSSVSVIIPAFNAAKFVGGAIESVLAQTFQGFEIIIVDDGSRDDTNQAVAPYLADSRVRYVQQSNHGASHAKNVGARIALGQYVLFLDADDTIAPSTLEVMRQRFHETGAAWCIVDVVKRIGENRTIRHVGYPAGELLPAILEEDFITRSPFYVRQAFLDCGMYDETLQVREDWDINIRMIMSGRPFVYIPEPLYIYARTEGSLMTGNRLRVLTCTEMLLRKHHKRLADTGDRKIARIYASNMWNLARQYFYEMKKFSESFRCIRESLRYDMNVFRLLHPVLHRIKITLVRR
jgi:glycosyltransferase involved in cell wall biosynthesis